MSGIMSSHVTRQDPLEALTAHLDPPFAAVDLAAFDANAADLVRRANGVPIRVASKSLRCRALVERALARPGYRGVMSYSDAERSRLPGRRAVLRGKATAGPRSRKSFVIGSAAVTALAAAVLATSPRGTSPWLQRRCSASVSVPT
jgi:hypothetical protein